MTNTRQISSDLRFLGMAANDDMHILNTHRPLAAGFHHDIPHIPQKMEN
jgi:hypothetical protein